MDSILSKFNYPPPNFWNTFPEFKVPALFNKFYTNDKSKDKSDSSLIMWAIAFFVETNDNRYGRMSTDEKKKYISEDVLRNGKFDFDNYKEIIDFWILTNRTVLQRQLLELENKLDERAKLLSGMSYNLGNFEKIDKLITSSSDIEERYQKLKERIESEKDDNTLIKGGRKESFIEKMR